MMKEIITERKQNGKCCYGLCKNNKKVTWKEFARMLAVLAVPIAMQNLLATTASMVDTIMIGSEGEIAVAAVGVCAQIGSLLFSTYWGFVSCSLLFMSQYWGAKDPEGMNKAFGLAIICAGIFGIACGGDCGCTGVDTWNIYR